MVLAFSEVWPGLGIEAHYGAVIEESHGFTKLFGSVDESNPLVEINRRHLGESLLGNGYRVVVTFAAHASASSSVLIEGMSMSGVPGK